MCVWERAEPHLAKVTGHGAWSSLGRRKAQEDAFGERGKRARVGVGGVEGGGLLFVYGPSEAAPNPLPLLEKFSF